MERLTVERAFVDGYWHWAVKSQLVFHLGAEIPAALNGEPMNFRVDRVALSSVEGYFHTYYMRPGRVLFHGSLNTPTPSIIQNGEFAEVFAERVRRAQSYINVCTYLIDDLPAFIEPLNHAVQRGLEVNLHIARNALGQIITPKPVISEMLVPKPGTFERLFKGNIYVVDKLHSKVALFDCNHVIIGSHNLTGAAIRSNLEVSVLIKNIDHDQYSDLMDMFFGLRTKGERL